MTALREIVRRRLLAEDTWDSLILDKVVILVREGVREFTLDDFCARWEGEFARTFPDRHPLAVRPRIRKGLNRLVQLGAMWRIPWGTYRPVVNKIRVLGSPSHRT